MKILLTSYINYYKTKRINLKLKGMNPVEYRTHSQRVDELYQP